MRGIDARTQTVTNSSAITLMPNQNTGMNQVFKKFVLETNPRLGPDGPPRNNVVAIADIVVTFMNSARKKIAKRMPVYSVLNPPTSSCSASTRSNGGWFVSAVAAIKKIAKATNVFSQNHCVANDQAFVQCCWATISCVESDPASTSTP